MTHQGLLEEIDHAIARNRDIDAIDDLLDRTSCSDRQKGALWLYALDRMPRRRRRRLVHEYLAMSGLR